MITLIAAVVGGILTIGGQVVVRIVSWVLRDVGDVLLNAYEWQVIYPEGVNEGGTRVIGVAVPGGNYRKDPDAYPMVTASYALSFELFNEKDVDTALQELHVVFYRGDEEMVTGELLKPGASSRMMTIGERLRRKPRPQGIGDPYEAEELLVGPPTSLELPSRKPVYQTLIGKIEGESGRKVMRSDRASIEGYFPDGRKFSKQIALLTETSELYGDTWNLTREQPRNRFQRLVYKFR